MSESMAAFILFYLGVRIIRIIEFGGYTGVFVLMETTTSCHVSGAVQGLLQDVLCIQKSACAFAAIRADGSVVPRSATGRSSEFVGSIGTCGDKGSPHLHLKI